jgi:hypothetical protein
MYDFVTMYLMIDHQNLHPHADVNRIRGDWQFVIPIVGTSVFRPGWSVDYPQAPLVEVDGWS